MSDSVLEIFREEAREHLGALEKGFLDLEGAATVESRRPLIDHLFRHAHSLKGDARAIGLQELQVAAEVLEDLLDELRDDPVKANRAAIDSGLLQLDRVRKAFDRWQISATSELPEVAMVTQVPAKNRILTEESSKNLPSPESSSLPPPTSETLPTERPTAPVAPAGAESFTVRVPSDRLDRMLNLAGEIRIAQRSGASVFMRLANLKRILEGWPSPPKGIVGRETRQAVKSALEQLRRVETGLRKQRTREEQLVESLEGDIRQARLLPLLMLADSLRRTVRDVAQSLEKKIHYDVDVGKVFLDKAVIEALREPLLHLVRNAADHGIETPDQRRKAGKPLEGTLRIQAQRRGELVRITVSDDGRGLDYRAIRDGLRRHVGLGEEEIRAMSDQEVARFIFQAGFTTVQIGDVSGRGVGLDVVQETLHRLQGNVELDSSSSSGSTFVLTVPVSISTVRIVSVGAGGLYYGIPSSTILRTGRATQSDLRVLGGTLVLPIDDVPVRWVHLSELLGLSPNGSPAEAVSYLLIAHEGSRMAVAIDELEEEREVLLKPLGFPLGRRPGIVGGTIRPDGTVQIVLDLSADAFGQITTRQVAAKPSARVARILVVDDSPTTRAILRNVLTAAGYRVWTANDGIDALERLKQQPVDVVVCDIEMPRLGGIDLTRRIKAAWGIPVILVTAREKEVQRREGLEAGADAYVVKSTFEGTGLLDVVQQFVPA